RSVVLGGPSTDRAFVDIGGATGSVRLAGGAVLDPQDNKSVAVLHVANGSTTSLEPGALEVSGDRRWVTSRLVAGNGYGSAVAHDVLTGDTIPFDTDCFVADDMALDVILVCG